MSGWLPGFLLGLAPLLALVVLLIGGRYPGESAIDRCRRALILLLTPARGRAPARRRAPIGRPPVRGGRLIARSLAGRGPPFTAPSQTGS